MSFAGQLEDAARRFADRTALAWDGGALRYAELHERAASLAGRFAEAGVGPGDRIAILLPNGWPFVVALLAGFKLGATVAPVDPLLKPEELANVLADLAPAVVLDDPSLAVERRGTPRSGVGPGAMILYTSGSSGRPKGAVLEDAALSFGVRSWAGPVMALQPADRVLGVLPFAHSFGINGALLAPLLSGAAVVLLGRFSTDVVAGALEQHAVTVFPAVATMFRRLLDHPGFAGAGPLRIAVSGAAPCPGALAEEWRRRTGVRVVRGYGMTELFRPISFLALDPTDVPESVGRALPGVLVRVVGESGEELGPAVEGELLIRTPGAMREYWSDPEETRAVLRDGWFRTGDLASLSPEGFVRITGRKRERIVRGGYSVSPAEVEAVLLAHPGVAEAAVVGVDHRELGEEVAAFVVPTLGGTATPEALVAWCRERLAGFKYPRAVTLVTSLPKSATGKLLKALLK